MHSASPSEHLPGVQELVELLQGVREVRQLHDRHLEHDANPGCPTVECHPLNVAKKDV